MYSMTGYGKGVASADGREITVELKSVNHRFLDVSIRLPRHLTFLEDGFRVALGEQLSRGHIDVFVNYRNTRSDARTVTVDEQLMTAYIAAAHAVNEKLGLKDDLGLTAALKLPDVAEVREANEDTAAVTALAAQAMLLAISQLKSMRLSEGGRLKNDLSQRTGVVSEIAHRIAAFAPQVIEGYRAKLTERIEALMDTSMVDRARLATEVALFADKASIDEELVRLDSHVAQMRLLLNDEEPTGRKLDFVVQEMNREFNTIGSKANDATLTNHVLAAKAEIEKIREQVQNIE